MVSASAQQIQHFSNCDYRTSPYLPTSENNTGFISFTAFLTPSVSVYHHGSSHWLNYVYDDRDGRNGEIVTIDLIEVAGYSYDQQGNEYMEQYMYARWHDPIDNIDKPIGLVRWTQYINGSLINSSENRHVVSCDHVSPIDILPVF
jgi:hypothetical protein